MVLISTLTAISLLAGAIQDVKENQISDYTWIPAAAAGVLMVYTNLNNQVFLAFKLVMVAVILALSYLLGGGLADAIGLAVIVIDDDPFAPIGTLIIFTLVTVPYAIVKVVIKKERKVTLPLDEFMGRKNLYPVKVIVDGVEERLSKVADNAYKRLEELQREDKKVFVEAETGLPAIVPMCIGYLANMMLSFYLGKYLAQIFLSILLH
ncbi:MAG: hypothetical protein QXJ17_00735 [Nitrososphaeria archaeon]